MWMSDALEACADEHGSPLAGRFIEWDTQAGYAHYAAGPLSSGEGAKMMGLFPDLYGVILTIEYSRLRGDIEYAPDEEAARRAIEDADKWLRDLHNQMALTLAANEETMESVEHFIDTAQGNGWTYEANGEMRNV
jgi:hypothetical protein